MEVDRTEAGPQFVGKLHGPRKDNRTDDGLASLLRLGARSLLDGTPAEAVVLAVGRSHGAAAIESAARHDGAAGDEQAMRDLADGWLTRAGQRPIPPVVEEEGVIAGRIGEPRRDTVDEGVWRLVGFTDRRAMAGESTAAPVRSVLARREAAIVRCRAAETGWLTGVVLLAGGRCWSSPDLRAIREWGETVRPALSALVASAAGASPAEGKRSSPAMPWSVRLARLSPTERRVFSGLVAGRTERQIAGDLSRSPNTVHVHVKSIYLKLGVKGRDELEEAVRAANHGTQPLSMPHDGPSIDHDVGREAIARVG